MYYSIASYTVDGFKWKQNTKIQNKKINTTNFLIREVLIFFCGIGMRNRNDGIKKVILIFNVCKAKQKDSSNRKDIQLHCGCVVCMCTTSFELICL